MRRLWKVKEYKLGVAVGGLYFVRQVCGGGDAGGGKLKRMVQISGTGG